MLDCCKQRNINFSSFSKAQHNNDYSCEVTQNLSYENWYSLIIIEKKENAKPKEVCIDIICDCAQAEFIFNLFHNNSISPVHAYDILDDFSIKYITWDTN